MMARCVAPACNAGMKPVARVRLVPARSNLAIAFVLVASTASASLVVLLALPWWLRALVIAACAAQCALALRQLTRERPQWLVVGADRRVMFAGRDGVAREGAVADATYVSGCITSLVWRATGRRRFCSFCSVCLIAPDTLPAEEHRQLRVVLRCGRARQADEDAEALAAGEVHAAPRNANAAQALPASHVAASTHTPLSLLD